MDTCKIMVAMSGGVDSSVTAALLKAQGHDVAGVTMRFAMPQTFPAQDAGCCASQAVDDAASVCRMLGIEHHVLDYANALETLVIQDFIDEYAKGRTPNPCVRCNRYVKFGRLFDDIGALGATHLATGHYVRNVRDPLTGDFRMLKALDQRKDQSYFLYAVARARLPFLMFPLGDMTKDAVREQARRFGLPVADKKDSQDICFIPDGKYQDFLASRGVPLNRPGSFVDSNGKVVGEHKGIAHYTIGQREGLGIALGVPVYVNCIDPLSNTVHLGPQEKLLSVGLEASGLNLLAGNISQETIEAGVKIRYNHNEIHGSVTFLGEDRIRVLFARPHKAVTPGQSVVIYDGDIVLGGAVIDRAIQEHQNP